MIIDIAKEFSPHPSGRVPEDAEHNGQRFRKELLIPALVKILEGKSKDKAIVIDIDGVRVFGSSFLEEAFGGLAREQGFDKRRAIPLIQVKPTLPHLKMFEDDILLHLKEALKSVKSDRA